MFLQNDARLLWNTVFSLWETAMYTAGPIPIKEQTAPDSPLMYCAIQPVWSFPTPPDPRLSRAVRSAQQRSVRAIWYSMPAESGINHVALYIGNGQVVHASNERTGICVSEWTYRNPAKIVNVLGD